MNLTKACDKKLSINKFKCVVAHLRGIYKCTIDSNHYWQCPSLSVPAPGPMTWARTHIYKNIMYMTHLEAVCIHIFAMVLGPITGLHSSRTSPESLNHNWFWVNPMQLWLSGHLYIAIVIFVEYNCIHTV